MAGVLGWGRTVAATPKAHVGLHHRMSATKRHWGRAPQSKAQVLTEKATPESAGPPFRLPNRSVVRATNGPSHNTGMAHLRLGVRLGVSRAVKVGLREGEGEGLPLSLRDGEGEAEAVGVRRRVQVGEREGLTEAVLGAAPA